MKLYKKIVLLSMMFFVTLVFNIFIHETTHHFQFNLVPVEEVCYLGARFTNGSINGFGWIFLDSNNKSQFIQTDQYQLELQAGVIGFVAMILLLLILLFLFKDELFYEMDQQK